MMRALIVAMCFGAVVFTAPSLWALQEEETKAESQPDTPEASDTKADDKKAADKDAEATDDEKKKAKAKEDAEAEKKKKDEVKENAEAAQAELEKAEAATPKEATPEAPAEPAPAVEVVPEAPAEPAPAIVVPLAKPADATAEAEAEPKKPSKTVRKIAEGNGIFKALRGSKDSKKIAETAGISKKLKDGEGSKESLPWAGSSISWGLNTDLATLIPALNEDWNETVKTSIKLKPSWVLNKQYSLSGNLGFTCEFTTPGSAAGGDDVARCIASNLSVALSLGELYNIYDVSIRGRASLSLPTNTYTREMGGLYGVNAGVSATRKFDELGGVSLTYSFGISHDGTKSLYGMDDQDERSGYRVVAPRISETPLPETVPVDYNYVTGALVGFSNGLSASYTATDWLSLSGSFSFENTLIEEAAGVQNDGEFEGGISENIVQLTGNDTRWRAFLSYSLVASMKIPQVPYLSVSTGLAWYQKAPHYTGSYVAPLRPKDTSIFLNLSVNAAKLMDELL
ncbi:MAG: hypothetical protein HOK28_20120 [Deltaproteobacteria bacterium]|nr:hypothetical protein [Deltaproteobacteria bacterium]